MRSRTPFTALANMIGVSERTLRDCFNKKPVTWRTARKIAEALDIDMREIVIKNDHRGVKRQKKMDRQDRRLISVRGEQKTARGNNTL